jgi:hypothetical protein
MDKFYGNFSCVEDVIGAFDIKEADLKDATIIAAVYDGGGYDGSAMVVFRKEGKLYEVHGSHCSCYGLEGQWSPEETTLEALQFRVDNGQMSCGYGEDFYKGLVRGLIDEMFEREVLN